jgi:hypothetical protein
LVAYRVVGDDDGWDLGVDYDAWASGMTFDVGHTLGTYVTYCACEQRCVCSPACTMNVRSRFTETD